MNYYRRYIHCIIHCSGSWFCVVIILYFTFITAVVVKYFLITKINICNSHDKFIDTPIENVNNKLDC